MWQNDFATWCVGYFSTDAVGTAAAAALVELVMVVTTFSMVLFEHLQQFDDNRHFLCVSIIQAQANPSFILAWR